MTYTEIVSFLNSCDIKEFIKLGHNNSQHRIFGFITTNIRRWTSFIDYIEKIVPEYNKRKKNLSKWKQWCYSAKIQNKYKQIFKRFELAYLLFRNLDNNPNLNSLALKLYESLQREESSFIYIFLAFYLLKGKYWQVERQPLVEINKIINTYKGKLEDSIKETILEKKNTRLLLAMVFYNPSFSKSEEIALDLLKNKMLSQTELNSIGEHPLVKKRIKNAGGINNFYADVFLIINYYILKQAVKEFSEDNFLENKDAIIEKYVSFFYEYKLNEIVFAPNKKAISLEDKPKLILFLKRYFKYIQDIVLFALNIKEEDFYEKQKTYRKGNIKTMSLNKFSNECFFSFYGMDKEWHKQSYFLTKKNTRYLEAHHIIKLEHSALFKNDLDVVENLIPLCPNCHRKLHNAEDRIVAKLLKVIYSHIDKKAWMKKGIFVDIDTLISFYGLSKDSKDYK